MAESALASALSNEKKQGGTIVSPITPALANFLAATQISGGAIVTDVNSDPCGGIVHMAGSDHCQGAAVDISGDGFTKDTPWVANLLPQLVSAYKAGEISYIAIPTQFGGSDIVAQLLSDGVPFNAISPDSNATGAHIHVSVNVPPGQTANMSVAQLQSYLAGFTPFPGASPSQQQGAIIASTTPPADASQGGFWGPLLQWLQTEGQSYGFVAAGVALITAGIAIMALTSKPVQQFVGGATGAPTSAGAAGKKVREAATAAAVVAE